MRLEGQSKMGYYPTPPEMVKLIKEYLHFPYDKVFYALDPCCGDGTALNMLIANTKGKSYGVELDKHRAKQAEGKIDFVISSAIENTNITKNNFSLMLLNPPYDWDESGERKETLFLAETAKYLMPGGILVFIIPFNRLNDVWHITNTHFENLSLLKFPSEYYEAYNQIVIFAKKKKKPSYTSFKPLKYEGELGKTIMPKYNVPKRKGSIISFKAVDTSDIKESFSESVWDNFYSTVKEAQASATAPLLPLREGHISLLLACGYLDGQVGGHVAKGTVVEDVISESAGERIKEKTILKASIKILDKNGSIKELH